MFEIIERSMSTGAISRTFSGYITEEAAEADMEEMAEETDDYWYEVTRS